MLLAIGTGIGGAILEGGRLVRGRRSAGQLGHLVVEPEGPPCLCGNRGCIETLCAGPALGRLIREAGLLEGTRVEALLAGEGGERGAGVLRAWAAPLRQAVDSLVAALDPEAGLALGPTELDSALRSGRSLIALSPLRESGYRLLMEALAARGEAGEALVVYDALRSRLRDELGIAVGPATQAIYRRLLAVT